MDANGDFRDPNDNQEGQEEARAAARPPPPPGDHGGVIPPPPRITFDDVRGYNIRKKFVNALEYAERLIL